MTTLIIGANGQIGQTLIKQLCARGERPRAMVRAPAPHLAKLGAEVVIADLEQDFSGAFKSCDKIVFTAGSGASTGADKTILVDMWGAMRAVNYAKQHPVKQFVMISSRGAEDPDNGPAAIKHYSVCKKLADDHLLQSGLPYTILRPGRLTNEPATGLFSTTMPSDKEAQMITREDVASATAYCLQTPGTIGNIYPLVNGREPMEAALGH
ncbi:SDR family oxidoreductase [Gilvimarinus agarilyticus]|uniref:SDR family oxidoreductase n=1 Tax=Gilvimarinus agarilyticus TaxID=679259 RepID=UPI0005A006C6|nr:SDR family oxidoreductase [Gilvimarinus agarilyticus]